MILVDDPNVLSAVRNLAAEMGCSEEEAIGRAVAAELRARAERPSPVLAETEMPGSLKAYDADE